MPDEVEEIQPAAEEPIGDAADTMSDGEPLIGDADAIDVSDTMAESSLVSDQEQSLNEAPMRSSAAASLGSAKPKSNIFSLILILSFLCMGLAIYLLAHELNNFYGVTFGGILSPPNKTAETTETEK